MSLDLDKTETTLGSSAGSVALNPSEMGLDVADGSATTAPIVAAPNDQTMAFLTAAFRGNTTIVKELLKTTDIDVQSPEGKTTALMAACAGGHIDTVKLLLERGAKRNLQSKDGLTALHEAVIRHHDDVVDMLLDDDHTEVDVASHKGWTPVHFAVMANAHHMVWRLLEAGAVVNHRDNEGLTPLHVAAIEGHPKVAALLTARGADVDARTNDETQANTPLILAASYGREHTVKFLLEVGAHPEVTNKTDHTPLSVAHGEETKHVLASGHEIRQHFLETQTAWFKALDGRDTNALHQLARKRARVDQPDDRGWTFLYAAAANGYEDGISILLRRGADPTTPGPCGRTPLHVAAERGDVHVMEKLLQHPSHFLQLKQQNADGLTALWPAAMEMHAECVELLAHGGANCSAPNPLGETLLFHVNSQIAETLIRCHCNVNARAKDGRTAMHTVCARGAGDVLRVLIAAQADVDLVDKAGNTALHSAAAANSVECIRLLVERGALLNAANSAGATPLHVASRAGANDAARALLGHGADAAIRDAAGKTAAELGSLQTGGGDNTERPTNEVSGSRSPSPGNVERASPSPVERALPPQPNLNMPPSRGESPSVRSSPQPRGDYSQGRRVDGSTQRHEMRALNEPEADALVRSIVGAWAPSYLFATRPQPSGDAATMVVETVWSKSTPVAPIPLATASVHFTITTRGASLQRPQITYRVEQQELIHRVLPGSDGGFSERWLDFVIESKMRLRGLIA